MIVTDRRTCVVVVPRWGRIKIAGKLVCRVLVFRLFWESWRAPLGTDISCCDCCC